MHPNPRRILPVVVMIGLAAVGWWYFEGQQAAAGPTTLAASGTIEAVQVELAPEIGGRVVAVLADEGQAVQAGETLVRLDDTLLQAQLAQARAALALAQANYDLVAAGTSEEQRLAGVTAAELELESASQALQDLEDTAGLAQALAEQAVAMAEKALDQAIERVDNLEAEASQADIDAAHAAMILAQDRLEKAQKDFEPYEKKAEDNVIRAMLQSKVAESQKQYDATVTRYNNLQGTVNELDQNLARADLALAEARLADAHREAEKLADGPDLQALALVQARAAAAEARLAAARAGTTTEQLAVAEEQVAVAQAALTALEVQLGKLALAAPLDAVVLTRSTEPGETVTPGATLITLARLDELTITIFVPEDRYGSIRLGQTAQVSFDSFPGERFLATVSHIADQAEYTPRNVQTAEGRRTTVFAVKLALENPDGKLKPGMPGDVGFGEEGIEE